MADVAIADYITGLEEATLDGTEDLLVVQAGVDKRCSTQDIADLAGTDYISYTARLSQLSTAAPTVVFESNALGTTVTWTRATTGVFVATAGSAVFTAGKTIVLQSVSGSGGYADPKIATHQVDSTTVINFGVFSDFSTQSNNFLMDVEIRVYP